MDMKTRIVVVGAGGTGGNYLKELGRYLYSLPLADREKVSLTIVDADKVEERNCARQPFIREDVGLHKSSVMAQALDEVFHVKATSLPEYVLRVEQLEALFPERKEKGVDILVGCVDNHAARKVMHQYFTKRCWGTFVWLDSANEFSVGEIVTAVKNGRKKVSPDRSYYYPEIFKKELPDVIELSCQELNEIAPQHNVTNIMAGNLLLSQTCGILAGQVLPGIVYFDALKCQSRFVEYEGGARNGVKKVS